MRIVWLKSDYIAPPDTGGKIRSFNLIRRLQQRCDVTYLCFKNRRTPDTEPEIRDVASEVLTVHRAEERKQGFAFLLRLVLRMFSPIPYAAQKYRSRRILEIQQEILNPGPKSGLDSESPVLLCDFLDMAENIDWKSRVPKILFEHNVESQLWRQFYEKSQRPLEKIYFKFEHMRMTKYERRVCNRVDLVLTVSEEDKSLLKNELGVRSRVEVLPTGVDTEFFSPRDQSVAVTDKLVFLGSLDWLPNIDAIRWFLEEIYPTIREFRPSVSLDIVGRRPLERVFRLVEADPTVRLVADVPDVRPYLEASSVFVVPLRMGGGTRIKIYEAMAMGLPVVSTSLGAQGLDLNPGEHLEIADSAQEFARGVSGLLQDATARRRLARAGRRRVEARCGWDRVAETLHDYCLELAAGSPAPEARE